MYFYEYKNKLDKLDEIKSMEYIQIWYEVLTALINDIGSTAFEYMTDQDRVLCSDCLDKVTEIPDCIGGYNEKYCAECAYINECEKAMRNCKRIISNTKWKDMNFNPVFAPYRHFILSKVKLCYKAEKRLYGAISNKI